jgi:hypothetical protein
MVLKAPRHPKALGRGGGGAQSLGAQGVLQGGAFERDARRAGGKAVPCSFSGRGLRQGEESPEA